METASTERSGGGVPTGIRTFVEVPHPDHPGSNPGGASNFTVQIRSFVLPTHNPVCANCLEFRTPVRIF